MSNLIRLNPIRWPYSLQQLRADEPSRSFSNSPSETEYAHFDVYRFEDVVALVEPPPVDPATHRLEQRPPVEVDGVLTQQWEVLQLTDAEREAYYRATHPPRWLEFAAALPPEVRSLLRAAWEFDPLLKDSLSIGLGKAADGDSRVFLGAWQNALMLGLIPLELVQSLQELATQYDLPGAFVAGLAGPRQLWPWPENPQRGDLWTGPDGSEWIWEQPRAEDGTYLVDDPATEVVESALQWLPVEVEP